MKINRRDFLLMTAGLAAGCRTQNNGNPSAGLEQVFNAGPAANYAAEGVYARFCNQGFFLIRRGDDLFALSARCTHRRCKLNAERNHSFSCHCHGSTFDPDGHVTRGPAQRDLPRLILSENERGELLVKFPAG